MALDTKLKRMSAVGVRRLPWMRRFTPSPESSVDQADRQHVGFSYRGILAAEASNPVAEAATGYLTLETRVTGLLRLDP